MIKLTPARGSTIAAIASAALFATGCVTPTADGDPSNEETVSTSESGLAANAVIGFVAVKLYTGDDDKRDDSRVWVRVILKNGNSSAPVLAAGSGDTWHNRTWSDFTYINLPSSTRNQDIDRVEVSWRQGGGGFNGDNWNLGGMQVWAQDNSTNQWSVQGSPFNPSGDGLNRFTGSRTSWSWGWFQ